MATTATSPRNTTCPKCGGTGWRPEPVEGRVLPQVVPCECRVQQMQQRREKQAQIPPRFLGVSLENFETTSGGTDNRSLKSAKLMAQRIVEDYPINKKGFLFHGRPGVGKTHLAVATLRGLLARGFDCRFENYPALLRTIRNSYNPEVQSTEATVLAPVLRSEILLLDDLGAERATDWVLDTVYFILNERYERGLTTLVTTNCANLAPTMEEKPVDKFANKPREREPERLGDKIGGRIFSRLQEMCRPMEFEAEDRRVRD
jgi:DNA replication protein DnaC